MTILKRWSAARAHSTQTTRVRRPAYLEIADLLADDVAKERVRPGEQLPTHRALAEALGVTLTTATRAYTEARKRGLLRATVGRGTFVRTPSESDLPLRSGRDGTTSHSDRVVDLTLNTPLEAEPPNLRAALEQLARRPDLDDLCAYQAPGGTRSQREAAAALARKHGVEVEAEHSLVCSGIQHALFVALSCWLSPGETILAEELSYPGFRAAAELLHLDVRAVPLDRDGIIPEAVEELMASTRARALYCTPTLQNPTGSVLPLDRREALAELARRSGLRIIEDDVHRLLCPEAPPPIASLVPEHCAHLAGLSKALAGGLRFATLSGPAELIADAERCIWATTWMTPPLAVEIATQWIRDGTLERCASRKRREAERRQRLARSILGPRAQGHPSAYHVWLQLEEPWDAARFAKAALERGVRVTPGDAFQVATGAPPPAVRLSLSSPADSATLERALRALAELLDAGPDRAATPLL